MMASARRSVTATTELYPEWAPGFDLSDPDEGFEAVLDLADEMPPTAAGRAIENVYAVAGDTYGEETRRAASSPPGKRQQHESLTSLRGLGRALQRIASHILRASDAGVESTFTIEDWISIRASHEGVCAYCGRPCFALTIDHYAPISRGGTNTADNIVACCKRCNSRKWAKDPIAWMQAEGFDVATVQARIESARARRRA